jgi:hypothetical protein
MLRSNPAGRSRSIRARRAKEDRSFAVRGRATAARWSVVPRIADGHGGTGAGLDAGMMRDRTVRRAQAFADRLETPEPGATEVACRMATTDRETPAGVRDCAERRERAPSTW